MAATSNDADRSPAGATAAPAASSAPDAQAPSALTAAVFELIADGRIRTLDEIAEALAPSPQVDAVAAEIVRLRDFGMAVACEGGFVTAAPIVPLDRTALGRALAGDGRAGAAWQVEVVFATRSTNSDLLAAVRAHPPAGPVLRAAELQLEGRGRLGRRWSSAPGASLTASFALTIRCPLSALDGATLVCGLAVHDVLAAYGVRARLKWPNDVLVDGGKLAGILVEAHAVGESSVLVIGIGVNLAGSIVDAAQPHDATALRRATLEAAGAPDADRNELASRIARSLETNIAAFEAGGFGPFVGRWNAVDAFAGRCVTLDGDRDATRTGIARGVDDRGALLVDVDGRRLRIVAGDVSLRPAHAASRDEVLR